MQQFKLVQWLQVIILAIIPWVYLAFIWNQLPASIPFHFGLNGNPDKFGTKSDIWWLPAILSAKIILIYIIIQAILNRRKVKLANASGLLSKLSVVQAYFLSGLSLLILYWMLKGRVIGLPVLFAAVGLLLAFVGNSMYSLKPNRFAGFRVSWTLNNENIWRRTHHFASKVWFFGGIILVKISLLLSAPAIFYAYFSILLLMFAIPFIYSYNLYRKSKNESHV